MGRRSREKEEEGVLDIKVDVRISKADLERLEDARKKLGLTRSEMARVAIRQLVAQALGLDIIRLPIPKGSRELLVKSEADKIVIEFVRRKAK